MHLISSAYLEIEAEPSRRQYLAWCSLIPLRYHQGRKAGHPALAESRRRPPPLLNSDRPSRGGIRRPQIKAGRKTMELRQQFMMVWQRQRRNGLRGDPGGRPCAGRGYREHWGRGRWRDRRSAAADQMRGMDDKIACNVGDEQTAKSGKADGVDSSKHGTHNARARLVVGTGP
jgi:hypothetical protein